MEINEILNNSKKKGMSDILCLSVIKMFNIFNRKKSAENRKGALVALALKRIH